LFMVSMKGESQNVRIFRKSPKEYTKPNQTIKTQGTKSRKKETEKIWVSAELKLLV